MEFFVEKCNMCPRECGANRNESCGVCGGGKYASVSKIMTHYFEEPVISGTRGSGAVFFDGCPLGCVYCQNKGISRKKTVGGMDADELADAILKTAQSGVHNINLVTAGHCLHIVIPALQKIKPRLGIPIVYNTSAYEKVSAIKALDGLVDVYLPDYKYHSSNLAKKYSGAEDYPIVAQDAIAEMLRQTPTVTIKDGLITRGVIVRHLVLPSHKDESIKALDVISKKFKGAFVSVMRQYTPEFYDGEDKNLRRKLTSYEYNAVVNYANSLGLKGFMQSSGCENSKYTPDFD